nr:unnamed protein product [Callosobruchus chinensis]
MWRLGVLMWMAAVEAIRGGGGLKGMYWRHDALAVARCEVGCGRNSASGTGGDRTCLKTCLNRNTQKLGSCPLSNNVFSPFAAACIEECKMDRHCNGLKKCCANSCGVTCQRPIGLDLIEGLPEIPTNVRAERRKKRTVYIEWSASRGPGRTLYLIEERHHSGKVFKEYKLSEWRACSKTWKISNSLRHFMKAGSWYQFRVASVNENGTRGFSENSLPVRSTSPKPPPPPQNLTIGPLIVRNGSLTVKLQWSGLRSDLPLHSYKVFCSRRLHGAKALDSVLVQQYAVPKDKTYFVLRDLQPNSQYFLQVQALVSFGDERIKSEKSGLVLNTTEYINASNYEELEGLNSRTKIEDIRVHKIFLNGRSLTARIAWNGTNDISKYSIAWWKGPCHRRSNGYNHFATTKEPYFDIKDLQFNCTYNVSVKEIRDNHQVKSKEDTSITFETPSCDTFRTTFKLICS